MTNNKKKIIIIIIVFVLIFLIPISMKLKDGGSVVYKAILYKVTKYHKLNDEYESGYKKGWKIEILGIKIYEKITNNKIITESEYLFSLKNKYIGNASANIKLLEELQISKLANYNIKLETSKRPYILYINFTDSINESNLTNETITAFKSKMKMYSIILLALIENADEIHYNDRFCDCIDNIVKIKTSDLEKEYGNIKDYGKSVETLHSLLINIGYYDTNEETPVTMSIKENTLTNTGVTLFLTNLTNLEYTYGESYYIEYMENGNWLKVKPILKNYGFIAIGYTLRATQKVEIKRDWEWLYGKLPVGLYRINTPVILGSGGNIKTYPVSVEFIIEK